MANDFHEIRFPTSISLESRGGLTRRTEIVTLGSGREQRNARWYHARRRFEAGYGVKTLDDLHAITHFFEERRGRLFGFRWKDRIDYKSCQPSAVQTAFDQIIGVGDGLQNEFQLVKKYGDIFLPYPRPVRKPVAGTVKVAVNGAVLSEHTAWSVNAATGIITFESNVIPAVGSEITAGYEFDVPVRFDVDELEIDLSAFNAGMAPKIPLIEIMV